MFWKLNENLDRNIEHPAIYNASSKHISIELQRKSLPVSNSKTELLYCIKNYSTVVLIGETASGKSTQIPQYLYESGWAYRDKCIVCTQPRRIAAISIANRVCHEMGVLIGQEVGYSVKFDRKMSSSTKIKYCTDGVLIREIMSNPLLSNYSVIMVDEAHERSLNTDILMGLLKKIQQRRRKLKVIISSATMDAEKIKHFFDDRPGSQTRDSSIILNITGRKFPVDIFYLKSGARNYIEAAVNTALEIHKSELGVRGDILAFFPGSYEIDKAIAIAAENYLGSDLIMMPFHSSLPTSTQMQVFQSMPIGHRKFICATNIAETSLTIEEIKYVIDTGFVNLNFFDVKTGIDMLVTTSISKASARQRAGRCGRTEAGKCFRLMTEVSYNSLPSQTIPEIQRTDISWSILQLKALGIQDVIHFDFVSSPAVDKVIYALELLYCLGALDLQGNLTSDGEKMSEMAISPQLSKTLLMSYEYGCGEEILTIASMCSVEYPFITLHHQTNREKRQKIDESLKTFVSLDGDHFTYLNLYQEYVSNNYSRQWCDSNFVLFKILERAREVRLNLKQLITHFGPPGGVISSCVGDTDSIKKCMLTGLFTNIARLGNDGKYHTLKGNAEVNLHPTTVYAVFGTPPNWVMYNQLVQSLVPQMRDVSSVQPLWIYETANHFYQLTNFSNYKV